MTQIFQSGTLDPGHSRSSAASSSQVTEYAHDKAPNHVGTYVGSFRVIGPHPDAGIDSKNDQLAIVLPISRQIPGGLAFSHRTRTLRTHAYPTIFRSYADVAIRHPTGSRVNWVVPGKVASQVHQARQTFEPASICATVDLPAAWIPVIRAIACSGAEVIGAVLRSRAAARWWRINPPALPGPDAAPLRGLTQPG